MGQTQLLLVILAVLLVGIAIFVGLTMFQSNTEENTRNALIADLNAFASNAHVYYWKATTQGGGGQSFVGVTLRMIMPMQSNPNGTYSLESATQNQCIIDAVGNVTASNGDSLRVRIIITEAQNVIEIIN